MKSPLIQQVADQAAQVARAQEAGDAVFDKELARKANESVEETPQQENDRIREEEHGGQQQQKRRRRRRRQMLDEEAEKKSQETPRPVSPPIELHNLDIQA